MDKHRKPSFSIIVAILGTLYRNKTPMTVTEITRSIYGTTNSKTTVSWALNFLEEHGFVISRRKYYRLVELTEKGEKIAKAIVETNLDRFVTAYGIKGRTL